MIRFFVCISIFQVRKGTREVVAEEFSKGDSPIHLLDPRIKVSLVALFSLVVALTNHWLVLALAQTFSVTLLLIARLDKRKVALRLLIVNSFLLFLWFFLPFTYPGNNVLLSLGALQLSAEGVSFAFIITLKSNAIIAASIALLGTSSFFAIVHALSHFCFPDKLLSLCFFCFRYLHVVSYEYKRLHNALKIRCFRPETSIHTYKTYAYLFGILVIKSYDRSQRVYQAMLCRGFKGKFWMFDHFKMRKSDLISGMVMLLFIVGLVLLQWTSLLP